MLELTLFGSSRLRSGGMPLPRPRSGTGFWLLALLALRHRQAVERSYLAGLLWPDSTEEQALYNLRRNLTDLRSVLGADAERLQTPTRRTVSLDLAGARCDLLAFDAAIRRGDRAALEEAVSLYSGPLLEGCYEDWILPDRQQRQTDYLRALETLAADAPPAEAVPYLRLLLAIDPAQETAQRRLMRALAALGDHAGAARAYSAFRRYLKKELGAEPDARTSSLARRLRAEAGRPVPDAAPVIVRLPEPGTLLVGRTAERREVVRTLADSPLVTLIGSGGVGKTRLALAAARDAQGDCTDGVWFADLSSVSDPARVAAAVAATLDVSPSKTNSYEDALASHLGAKSLLLVLDNCEQVRLGAAALAARLLRDCPGVRLLATSRIPLGLKPEITYRVPSLAAPPESASSETLSSYAAVGLFVERARAVSPRFALDERVGPAVAHICRRLDGIPLAIELAAARVRTLTPEEIAAHLDERFRLLTGTRPGALRRQQTLRASLDWSWDLLDSPERAALSRLSVFAGSLTLEAAEAVLSASPVERWVVLDLLSRLVDWGLVVVEVGQDGERYRLLETVRQYAAERLRESNDEAAVARHRAFFLALARAALPNVTGPDGGLWLKRLLADHDNLRAALDSSRRDSTPDAAQEGLLLAHSLSWFWISCGHITEGRERLTAALAHPGAQIPTSARASALRASALLAYRQVDLAATTDFSEAALALFRALGEIKGEADALFDLGLVDFTARRPVKARMRCEQALALYVSIGEEVRANRARANIGVIALSLGDLDTAEAMLTEVQAAARALGEIQGVAVNLSNLGCIALRRGDTVRARAMLEEALAMHREMGHRSFHTAAVLDGLARASLKEGRSAEARACLVEAGETCRDVGLGEAACDCLETWARLYLALGLPAKAARLLGASDAARTALGVSHEAVDQPDHEAQLSAVRAALGDDAFGSAFQSGQTLSWQQALEEAASPA